MVVGGWLDAQLVEEVGGWWMVDAQLVEEVGGGIIKGWAGSVSGIRIEGKQDENTKKGVKMNWDTKLNRKHARRKKRSG